MYELKQQKENACTWLCYRVGLIFVFIWKHVKSWQFFYLLLFFLGELLSIFLNDPSNIASYYSPLFLLALSFLVKMLMLRNKINCKIFWRMQLDFASPYVLTGINMVLLLQSCFAMQSFYMFNQIIPNMTSYTIVNSLCLLFGTLICSLVMNKRTTTKMEYYMILINIAMQAISNLYITITTILQINSSIDGLRTDNQSLVMKVIAGQLDPTDYQTYYGIFSGAISALESSKDFNLACVASIISVLIILMDFIARPLEKLQHQQEIYEEFIKNYNLPLQVNRNTRNTILLQSIPQITPPLIKPKIYKQAQLKIIPQNSPKNQSISQSSSRNQIRNTF